MSWEDFVPMELLPLPSKRRFSWIARWIALAVAAFSLVVVLAHCLEYILQDNDALNLLQGQIYGRMTPMAFTTALSFGLCALALLGLTARALSEQRRRLMQIAMAAVVTGCMYVLSAFTLKSNLPTDADLPGALGDPSMSAFTAGLFVVAGLTLLVMLVGLPNRIWLASAGVCVLGLVNILIVLGYAYDVELLRHALGLNQPVALLTALTFFALDIGMIFALGPASFPLKPFVGPSPRALMLRSFLPAFVGLLVLLAWIEHVSLAATINTSSDALKEVNEALLLSSAIQLVATVALTAVVVYFISHRVAAVLDKSESLRLEALNRMAATIDELARTREDLVEANRDLTQARDETRQHSMAREFFLATVSHELRTPLNHVIGFLQLLEMTELTDDQRRDLGKIRQAANHLLALVNDLLDYQKMIQGVLVLEPTRVELGGWLHETADSMRPKAAERGNTLVLDCPADIGAITADEKRARQVLTNLLSNAAKFTRNGTITVCVRRERDAAGDWLRLDVGDTGLGMTAEQQTKLFQPFTKLLSRSENPEGTGLGLALSQNLCRLMGGDLTLSKSTPGQGSTFTVRLPARQDEAADLPLQRLLPPALPFGPGAQKAATVLVIDDEPEVREMMRRHLTAHGFKVELAASGAEGLEMVKRVAPDAITLDVLMPGIDGWGTLAALQADAETMRIPVILITMTDARKRGFALGAWEVLTKPVSWTRLIDLLHSIEPNAGPVLIVDDDPAFRLMGERTLNQHGWDVCHASDVPSALKAAAQRRPGLVLLNLTMPNMDGMAFLDDLQKQPGCEGVPVVAVTARELSEDDSRRLAGKVLGILPKGICGPEELVREVERLSRRPRAAAPVLVGQG
jgi:signal transduction histidine kinase/DNA-binding response OmpR family regulator